MDLTRRLEPYSVGYGRFRSGLAVPQICMIHRSQQLVGSGAIGTASDFIIPNLGQFGGYPGGRRNTLLLRHDNLQELMDNRQPLLQEVGNPADLEERFPGKVTDCGLLPVPTEIFEGDLLISSSAAAGGLGDPIERDPAWIKADLDSGLTTEWQASNVYCVKANYDEGTKEWTVDEAETEKLRQARRKQRLSRAVPVKDWWKDSRQKIVSRDMHPLILEMYQSSMKLSETFAKEYRGFWALPDDFVL
jgi:acetone carboxylase alpha subunit